VAMKQFLCQPLDRPPDDEKKQSDDRCYSEQHPITKPTDDAEHGANPDRGGGGETRDVSHRIAQNHSGTEKSDAGEETLDDPRDCVPVGGLIQRAEREKRSDRCAETNQRVRPQPGGLAMQLAIQSKDRSKEQRGPETQHSLFISSQHAPALSRKCSASCKHLVRDEIERLTTETRLRTTVTDSDYSNDPWFRFAPVRADAGDDVDDVHRRRWRNYR